MFRSLDSAVSDPAVRAAVRGIVDQLVLSGRKDGAERLLTYVSRFDEATVAEIVRRASLDSSVTNTVIDEQVEFAFGNVRFESRALNGPDLFKADLANHVPVDADTAAQFARIGEDNFVVFKPFDLDPVKDIDRFAPTFDQFVSGDASNVPYQLIEEKSASFAGDIPTWVQRNIFNKYDKYIEARPLLPRYEEATIVFDFTSAGVNVEPSFRAAVELAVEQLDQTDPHGVQVIFQ